MNLIPDWRLAWKFWSVQLAALGTIVTGILISFPDAALAAWALLPADMKAFLPKEKMPIVGVAIFALSIVARMVNQAKLQRQIEAKKAE
jgi:hypothetical protein